MIPIRTKKNVKDETKEKEVFITITYLSRNHKDSHNRKLKKHSY